MMLERLRLFDRRRSAIGWQVADQMQEIAKTTKLGFSLSAYSRPAQKFDNLEKFDMRSSPSAAFPALGIEAIGRGGQEEDRRRRPSIYSCQQLTRQGIIGACVEQLAIALELVENDEIGRGGIQSGLSERLPHPAQALAMFARIDRVQNVFAGRLAKFRA